MQLKLSTFSLIEREHQIADVTIDIDITYISYRATAFVERVSITLASNEMIHSDCVEFELIKRGRQHVFRVTVLGC